MQNKETARRSRLKMSSVISSPGRLSGFAIAAVAVLAAVGVRLELYPVLGEHTRYVPFVLAVLVAARFGGLLPGLMATALSAVSALWFFVDEADPAAVVALLLFLLTGTLISLLVGRLRGAFLATARAQEALRRQSQLIDLSHDAIITTDSEGRILKWNAGAQEMYGWTEREAVGKVIHIFLQSSGRISTAEIDATLGREGQWNGELSHTARDGSRLVVDSRHVLVRNEENLPAGILEINRNITDRKRRRSACARANPSTARRWNRSPAWSSPRVRTATAITRASSGWTTPACP